MPLLHVDSYPTCSVKNCERPVHRRGWCTAHYGRWYRTGNPLYVPLLGRLLPFEPLWALTQPAHAKELAERAGVSERTVQRWKAHGVPLVHADAVACKLGYNPVSIWPDWELIVA